MLKIDIEKLIPHPLNRSFEVSGSEWDEFVASVQCYGIMEPLIVRPILKGGIHQVLAGHRRLAAAKELEIDVVPCDARKMTNEQALIFLINSNLQRKDPNIVEEAKLIKAMAEELEMDANDICTTLNRTLSWVTTRQRVFDFSDEVISALQEHNESRRLSEGAFFQILQAPEELRERAVQLVLSNEGFDEPLSEERAMEEIQYNLIPAWKKEKAWEEGMEKRRAKVAAAMRKACKAKKPNINVQVQPWERGSQGVLQPKPALGIVGELLTEDAPEGLTWLDLAERMNAPVYVIPPDGEAVVSGKQVYDFEASLRDYAERVSRGDLEKGDGEQMKPWLSGDGKKPSPAVTKALSVLNGEGEADFDPDGPALPVATPGGDDGIKITQKVEHHAYIDMGAVRRLSLYVTQVLDGSQDFPPRKVDYPDFVPMWAREMIYDTRKDWPEGVLQICEWVLSLKAGGSGKG